METSQLICSANQLTGFCMMPTLGFTVLRKFANRVLEKELFSECQRHYNMLKLKSIVNPANLQYLKNVYRKISMG